MTQISENKYEFIMLFLFIKKIENYEEGLAKKIKNICGVPKFFIGDSFCIRFNISGYNNNSIQINKKCSIVDITKLSDKEKLSEVSKDLRCLNNYRYFYKQDNYKRYSSTVYECRMFPLDEEYIDDGNDLSFINFNNRYL